MTSTATRSAIVSGASSGIGHAVAEVFLERGYTVAGISRRGNPTLANRLGYLDLIADCRDTTAVKEAVNSATEALNGTTDAVVLNAGYSPAPADLGTLTWDTVADAYSSNVATALNLVQAAEPLLRNGGRGSLTFVGASLANGYKPERFAYAASKAAMTTLMRACSEEFAAAGVVSNEVRPGPVATAMTMPGLDPAAVTDDVLAVINTGYQTDWLKSARTVAEWIVTIAEFPPNGPTGQVFNYSRKVL